MKAGPISREKIVKFVYGRRYRPMTAREMADALSVPESERDDFHKLIRDLELAGQLVEVKNRRLVDPARVDLVVGTLSCNPRGFGFIRRAREADGEDLYVSGQNMSSAMDGDAVVARVPPGFREARKNRDRRRPDARQGDVKIISVLKRTRTEIVGTFRKDQAVRYVVPDNPRIFRDVIVAAEDTHGARPDDKVCVRITAWPTRHLGPAGKVVQVFGARGEPEVELESVAREFSLRREFPKGVLQAATHVPKQVRSSELTGRTDLTAELVLTIDPEDARDFDDAVSLRRLPRGACELGVHIADVSHYVPPDSAMDTEARARGTSVYLPGQVIPMLPEALSNRACSLRPNEVHLTRTVRMRYDADGRLRRTRIFAGFIKSAHRFTYKEVQAVIEGGALPRGKDALRRAILDMHAFAERLRKRRAEAGMIELALPEVHLRTDSAGRTTGVELIHNDASHRLIEQFMLAANEAVANHFVRHRLPYLCRAHGEPAPKAIQDLRQSARALGHNLPAPGTREQIQRFLKRLKGAPDESLLHYLLLRSMMPAEYSAERKPHYAVAAANYLHFTSPIRRYPDLLAHRILDEAASGRLESPGRRDYWAGNLPAWTAHATETERNAANAERALTNRHLLEFIGRRKAASEAVIIGVEGYGLRVQLCDCLLDGVVRMSSLSDGFYRLDRDAGALIASPRKQYRIGQTIKVRVRHYDAFKHQIEFEPVRPPKRR